MDCDKKFSSSQEEIEYWKQVASDYKKSHAECREELEEYEISSRELEAELEAQLEQQECRVKELVASNQRLQMEVESLREKYEEQATGSHRQQNELEDELAQVKAYKDELQKYIRELEQSNDDLERAKRATVVSLEDFEARLNQAIERNAFLENELEERETLAVTVQRLKDEARDLRQELSVKRTIDTDEEEADNDKAEHLSHAVSPLKPPSHDLLGRRQDKKDSLVQTEDSNKVTEEIMSNTPTKTTVLNHSQQNGTPLTPNARISALNIVGDLLRKVGALESKLASCRNFVNNQPRSSKPGTASPTYSPRPAVAEKPTRLPKPKGFRAKRLHRGASTPTPQSHGGAGGSGAGGAGGLPPPPSQQPTATASATAAYGVKVPV